ncbi:hypothetical protein ABTZ03_30855 [Kitasatospora sp. NPDC096077]|uniref:hypothetical protein n=1 Tax=Kitasatospora sp. NPDC096077 TaxID=3155544 RepID=UPI003326749C
MKKVKAPLPKALHQLTPAAPTADTAHAAYIGHRSRCRACTDPTKRCADGLRLGAGYLELLRQEPDRRAAQALAEQEQRRAERRQARQQPKRRAAEWADVDKAVKAADTQRIESVRGARGPIFGLTLLEDTPAELLKLPSGRVV